MQQTQFRERTKREDERFRLATDSEYWFVLCFRSREEKDAFLTSARLMHIGDKYLDGRAAAAVLGVEMPDPTPTDYRNSDPRCCAVSRPQPENAFRTITRRASSPSRGRSGSS